MKITDKDLNLMIGRLAEKLTPEELGSIIDHTELKPTSTSNDIKKLCEQAIRVGAASVCVLPNRVKLAKKLLLDTNVKVCTVTGFPLGAETTHTKMNSAREAFENGADEVDMVIDIAAALEGDFERVKKDIESVVSVRDQFKKEENERIVKVIIETCYLVKENLIKKVCQTAKDCNVDFVKSSTGFGKPEEGVPVGATFEFISWMREAVGQYDELTNPIGVKASGGINYLKKALELLIAAGGTDRDGNPLLNLPKIVRLGTSSGHLIYDEFVSKCRK